MSYGLDKLKLIGAQKIHEATHLTKKHVGSILNESFEGMNKVQFVGFISILEREYDVDLSELQSLGLEYFTDQDVDETITQNHVFVTPKKKRNLVPIYIGIVVIIFIVVTIFSLLSSSSGTKTQNTQLKELHDKTISSAEKIIETTTVDANNSTIDNNITKKEPIKELEEKTKVVTRSLKVKPKSKVWMGYIDLKTYKKQQKVFKDEFTMDTNKDWIIVFGHGHLDMIVDGKVMKYSDRNNLRFLYKDGKLTKITLKEFMSLNRGKKW